MVPEHKVRQALYHHLNPNPSDMNLGVPYKSMNDRQLAFHVIDYFLNSDHEICYPAKSYAVALIYAHLLEKHFIIPFDTSLRDPELLFHNDPFFVPYTDESYVYNKAISHLQLYDGLQYNLPQVAATVEYFDQEFFLTQNPYFDNANLHK